MRSAPLRQSEYPQYFKDSNALFAFVAPDKMFIIGPWGSNKNPGVTIDHYVTRNMVLKHWRESRLKITEEEFKRLAEKVFTTYIDKIVNH